MRLENRTHPRGQAGGCAHKSNDMVAQGRLCWRGLNAYYAFLGGVVLYGVLIFLHDAGII